MLTLALYIFPRLCYAMSGTGCLETSYGHILYDCRLCCYCISATNFEAPVITKRMRRPGIIPAENFALLPNLSYPLNFTAHPSVRLMVNVSLFPAPTVKTDSVAIQVPVSSHKYQLDYAPTKVLY
eukprot:3941970-Rhodomonas_salina.8